MASREIFCQFLVLKVIWDGEKIKLKLEMETNCPWVLAVGGAPQRCSTRKMLNLGSGPAGGSEGQWVAVGDDG